MSPKPSESNLQGELRVSEATERGEGLSPSQGRENFTFWARKNSFWCIYFEQRLLEENLYDCERADFFIFALKTYNSSQYFVDKSSFVGKINVFVFVTLVIWSCSLYRPENQKLEIYPLLLLRASRNLCTFASETCDSSHCFVGK